MIGMALVVVSRRSRAYEVAVEAEVEDDQIRQECNRLLEPLRAGLRLGHTKAAALKILAISTAIGCVDHQHQMGEVAHCGMSQTPSFPSRASTSDSEWLEAEGLRSRPQGLVPAGVPSLVIASTAVASSSGVGSFGGRSGCPGPKALRPRPPRRWQRGCDARRRSSGRLFKTAHQPGGRGLRGEMPRLVAPGGAERITHLSRCAQAGRPAGCSVDTHDQ